MRTNVSITFEDKEDLQSFLRRNADRVDLGSIQGQSLSCLDNDFIQSFKDELNLHKLFIQVIKNGDLEKALFCLNNGVSYHDRFSIREAMIMTSSSISPIDVAFDYGQDHIVDYFLKEGYLDMGDIYKFTNRLINKFSISNDRLDAAFKLIERLFNDYSLNPDYSGGAYLHSAMDGKYESVLKVLELLMDMGANVNYLDIYYNKDHNYLISSLKYINRFMEDKIDIGFFMSGKFTK